MSEPPTAAKGPFFSIKATQIMIIDDDEDIRQLLTDFFKSEQCTVYAYPTGKAALNAIQLSEVDLEKMNVIFCDLNLPDINGLDLISEIKKINELISIVLITAHASEKNAMEALSVGAMDYISKPINFTELEFITQRATRFGYLEKKHLELQNQISNINNLGTLIGKSPEMRKIYELISKIKSNESNILITGESGTGKELVAKTIHNNSLRKNGNFVAINCSAIPEGLLESELFGHEKGSFTGATNRKDGLFKDADRGTLFLDEIGDMPLILQAKLLRTLQEGVIKPVGANRDIPINVRVISATHVDLKKAIKEGRFREDLYYRLNVIPIRIPPIRERKEDIPLLVDHFIKKHITDPTVKKKVSQMALSKLLHHYWKGNVRELENTIERTLALSDSDFIRPSDILLDQEPTQQSVMENIFDEMLSMEELERKYINYVLKETNNKKEDASDILKINRKTLYRKLKKYEDMNNQSH